MVDIKSVLRLVRDGLETYAPDYMHGLPKRDYLKQIDAALAQPEQESVASGVIRTLVSIDKDGIETWKNEPFYTTPPQRTWVGLTDEETDHIIRQPHGGTDPQEWVKNLASALEAKLKEKNQ